MLLRLLIDDKDHRIHEEPLNPQALQWIIRTRVKLIRRIDKARHHTWQSTWSKLT